MQELFSSESQKVSTRFDNTIALLCESRKMMTTKRFGATLGRIAPTRVLLKDHKHLSCVLLAE
ncbi:hypothetical protein HZA38_00515 [Candidatus Peregrinibacteria bacterium]|nr:hypothetical protein [Candidatus Peregrinibacteria bacterium]